MWKHKRPWRAKAVLRKKNGDGGINLPDFRLHYKATVIKRVCYWHKTEIQTRSSIEQDRKPRNKHMHHGALFLTKKAGIHNGANSISLFSNWFWENWTATCKRMKSEHFLRTYTKINSKWIKDLNVRPETINLLEENIGRKNIQWHKSKRDPLWPTT